MPVSKKTRFEIFKRDKFTCQYCGKKAPEVILHADHIHPKSKGGSDDFLNLVTACVDCNQGKSDRSLCENTVLEKKQNQLEHLQERREQIEMLREWERELTTLSEQELDLIQEKIARLTGRILDESGRDKIKRLLRKHNLNEILLAVDNTFSTFYSSGNEVRDASYFAKALGGLKYKLRGVESSPASRIQYLSGILNRRIHMTKSMWASFQEITKNFNGDVENLILGAKRVDDWESFISLADSLTNDNLSSEAPEDYTIFDRGYARGQIGVAFTIQGVLEPLKEKFGPRFEKLEAGQGVPDVWCFLRNLDDHISWIISNDEKDDAELDARYTEQAVA